MDERMKQRLVGAAVLVLAAVIFVPMLLDQDDGDPKLPARIIQRSPPEPEPPPLPEDASARSVPLDSKPTAAAPEKPEPKLPAKTVKKATAAAGGTKTGFAVQVGSFSKSSNARGLRDKLVARGYTVFVKSSGSVTRVYVGPQSSRGEAEKVLKRLLAELRLKGIVVQPPG